MKANTNLEQLMLLSQMGAVSTRSALATMGIPSAEEALVRVMGKDTLYSCIEKGTSSPVMRKGNSYKKAYRTVQENPELLATYLIMPSATPPEYDQWALYFAAKDLFESLQEVTSVVS